MQNFNKVLCNFPAGRLKAFGYIRDREAFFIAEARFLKGYILHIAAAVALRGIMTNGRK